VTVGSLDKTVGVIFPSTVFGLEVLKRAAYRLLDRFTVDFRTNLQGTECVLHFPATTSQDTIDLEVARFRAEVLDQDLRRLVAEETAGVRNTILSLAFSTTDLVGRD